jgi:hypothetical protein
MPLDINAAPTATAATAVAGRGEIAAAVERYLAKRGFAATTPAVANVATEVVDRFLAKKETAKGAAESAGGYG